MFYWTRRDVLTAQSVSVKQVASVNQQPSQVRSSYPKLKSLGVPVVEAGARCAHEPILHDAFSHPYSLVDSDVGLRRYYLRCRGGRTRRWNGSGNGPERGEVAAMHRRTKRGDVRGLLPAPLDEPPWLDEPLPVVLATDLVRIRSS